MVEDELLHTAQQYTTHLHRAEYIRLKAVISSRNAHTIREMERPVVPRSGGSTLRGRAVRVRRKIVEGKQAMLEGGEAPWMGTSLQGLMEKGEEGSGDGKGRGGRDVSIGCVDGGDGLRTRTTAAAGCMAGGGRSRSRTRTRTRPSCESVSGGGCEERRLGTDGRGRMEGRKRVKEEEEGGEEDGEQKEEDSDDDDDDDDPFGVKRRRARRMQSREQMKRRDRGREREKERDRESNKNMDREGEKRRDVMPSFL
ncbi:hypothetical protein E4U33_007975 [Claviceps sp. LM78 group G4]|nr:hypothetical protein E4U33_007975 [Claviceps sp. LM78 group G4]